MTKAKGENIVTRPIVDEEVGQMVSLWSEAGLPTKPAGRDTVENLGRQLLESPDLFIGAFVGDRMVGIVMGSDDGRKGWINRLAVAPDMQRSGIASTLLELCEVALRKRGRQIICTLIEDDNNPSEAFFLQNGFKREDGIAYYTKRDADDV
ncbi:MAG: GNAT family N-acetyltransferase [Methanobacteriota archaeon]|nr:MAG: GNAT family N-acetyltransferase [Euryarchaeota archaeon]